MKSLTTAFLFALALAPTGCASAPAPAPPAAPAEAAPLDPAPAPDDGVARVENDTLLLEATPAVPDELRERLEQYLNTRAARLTDLRADGAEALVLTRFAETRQIHRVRQPMGARTQLTFGDEPIAAASFVPDDPHAVLYLADVGGDENHQLFWLDLRSGRATLVTDGTSKHHSALWSRDGARLAYASNARNGRDFDIWVSDGRPPAASRAPAKRVVDATGYFYPVDWSPDGERLLVGEYRSITESHLHLVDLATGALTRVSPEAPPASYRDAFFSRDGKSLYVTSDREGEHAELYETDLTGSSWRSLTRHIPWSVTSATGSPDGRTLAVVTNEDGRSRLRLIDARTRRELPTPDVPLGVIGGLRFARDANVLGFTLATATNTGDAFTYDLRKKALARWTDSEMGGLDGSRLVEPTLIHVESFDGLRVPGFLYRPPGPGPFPVLINIHGGPESQARPTFNATMQYLVVERGVAVLYPNVRGSAGYGKTYVALDDGFKREDSVKDIGAFLDHIAQDPTLDADRVGVIGGSYGGYMVLASLMHYADRIKAGLNVVGISSFVTFLQNTSDYRRDLRRAEYGDERDPEMRAFLDRISPLNHAERITSALFVAQGLNDPRVPASEARQVVDAVRSTGADVWYMLAKNEGHGFAKKENSNLLSQLAILFFERHLLGE